VIFGTVGVAILALSLPRPVRRFFGVLAPGAA